MEAHDIVAGDVPHQPMLQARKHVEPCQSPILGRGTRLQPVLDMIMKKLREKFAKSSRPTRLVQGGCGIAAGSDLAQKLLRPRSRLIGSEDAMHPDGDPTRAPLATAQPILDEV